MVRPIIVLSLALTAAPLCAQVKLEQKDNSAVVVEIDRKPFTTFYVGNENGALKPYLHPLRAATGTVVTRGFPMLKDIPGESHDHAHHRGLWFAHGDVNGIDYWGGEVARSPEKKGTIELVKIDKVAGGAKSGTIEATFRWHGPDGKTVLTENRRMTFYSAPSTRTIDLDITLKAVQRARFGDTKEGTFAIRLAAGLEEPQAKSLPEPKRTGLMTASDGKKGEKQVWGKRAPWVDYAGELAGEKVGVAIFDHPSNPRYPTYWHSRSYGLFAANIFGVHDFENDKTKDGSLTLEPGQTLRFRYRVVIHPGDTASAGLENLYREYSGKSR
jgi:hypothetical protein